MSKICNVSLMMIMTLIATVSAAKLSAAPKDGSHMLEMGNTVKDFAFQTIDGTTNRIWTRTSCSTCRILQLQS
jgi:hypothetical protein